MSQANMSFEEAICFPVRLGFVIFTDAAVRNGATPVLTYEDKDRVEEMRRTGKTWFLR